MGARPPIIAVCGASRATDDEYRLAYECGEMLARRGATVLNGGLGGVMAASAAGVRAAGGTCVAFLPGNDQDDANDEVSIALPTGLGEVRNTLIVRCCAALIAIGGGWGTLSEIAFAARTGRPVAMLQSWKLAAPHADDVTAAVYQASGVVDAVAWVLERASAAR